MSRISLPALVLAVAAIHAAALWLLLVAAQPRTQPVLPVKRAIEIVWIDLPVKREAPASRQGTVAQAVPTARAARPVRAATTPSAARHPLEPESRQISAMPAEAPMGENAVGSARPPAPLILHSEALRRALRDTDREQSFAERARNGLNLASPASGPNARLSAAVSGAAHGDCLKGQFRGSGAGLMSLGPLVIAAARGECPP